MNTPIHISVGIVDLSKKLPAILAVLIITLENHKLTGSEDIENGRRHMGSMHLQTQEEILEVGIVIVKVEEIEIMRREVGNEGQIEEKEIEREIEIEEIEREILESIILQKEESLLEEKRKRIGIGLLLMGEVERGLVSGKAPRLVAVAVVGIAERLLPLKQPVEVTLRKVLDMYKAITSTGHVAM